MKKLALSVLAALSFEVNAASCSLSDVTIEGASAISCVGMLDGNANSLEDVNGVLSTSYTDIAPLQTSEETFSFEAVYSNIVEIVLKQNTSWAIYRFDLSALDNIDGVWNGTWSTSGLHWDNKPDVRGCQGCGELSHSFVVGNLNEVPLPGTLGLLGIGLLGLGAIRRRT